MNIVYVITRSDSIGGAHIHVRDLGLAMQRQGHSVTVLTGGEGPYFRELHMVGLPCYSIKHLTRPLKPNADLRGFLELRKVIQKLQPDVVSTHSSKAGLLGRLAARSLGIPVIFTAHGWAFTEGVPRRQRQFYSLLEKLTAPIADKIVNVSESDRHLALRYNVASSSKLVTVHNGMPNIPDTLLANPTIQPPRIIMVARFEEQKDHELLLHALGSLLHLPWTLEFIGDGPLLNKMQQLAAALDIKGRVEFLGARKDVEERLSRAQLFVLASRWEGFPRSILEAMRAGLPIIASNVGGVCESVSDGESGLLVKRGDLENLRASLLKLLTKPELRQHMGQIGRTFYLSRFTFDSMLEKTMCIYEDLEKCRLQTVKYSK